MSSITSALTYKLQKMEKQMEALTEENYRLRSMLNEVSQSPAQLFTHGAPPSQPYSGAVHGALMAGNVPDANAYVGQYGGPSVASTGVGPQTGISTTMSAGRPGAMAKPTMPLGSRGMGSVAQGAPATTNMTPAARSLAVQASGAMNTGGPVTPPTGGFDGGYHGYLLATDPRAAAAYVAQFQAPSVTGMRTGASMPSVTSTTQRRR
jgi:hypothetical protein